MKNGASRIVSLVPSQTELLAHYGMDEQVVGITKFCVHPEAWFRSKQRVGGTKNFKIDQIRALEPDLVIANKEENTKEGIEALQEFVSVYVSDIPHLAAAKKMIEDLAILSGDPGQGTHLWASIQQDFNIYRNEKNTRPLKVAYLIWWNPLITVGGDTFIHSMLNECGFQNVFGSKARYPQIGVAEIQAAQPDLILLSSEPFPFKEKHQNQLKTWL
ncbi:MAG: helical backbone metal receptor, partial [Bacteroidota bacterium]